MSVKVTINGNEISVPKDYTIREAARQMGENIPTLCYLKDYVEDAHCRICVVDVEGSKDLVTSCSEKVKPGMVIQTKNQKVKDSRKATLKLLASRHIFSCWTCPREDDCQFLDTLRDYRVEYDLDARDPEVLESRILNDGGISIIQDSGKCILCKRCENVCTKMVDLKILKFREVDTEDGLRFYVTPTPGLIFEDAGCILCGQCTKVCPTGALTYKSDVERVEEWIEDPDIQVLVQTAPAVRASFGEEFGQPIGTNAEGEMFDALRKLGFDVVTDTSFTADLTIMEEGTEFINRVTKAINGEETSLPMMTSCSPGWVRYLEMYQPSFIPNLSTAKSPMAMLGSVAKHHYAKEQGIDNKKYKVVTISPCTAKKYEAARPELENEGLRDIDAVLTVRELGKWLRSKGYKFSDFSSDNGPDSIMGEYTGAGIIFGATGGVMEAALRTVYYKVAGKELDNIDLVAVRGIKDIKEATIEVPNIPFPVNVAVVHGPKAANEFFRIMEKGEKEYHFIEFMGCTGGCVNGGGQPIVHPDIMETVDVRTLRANALYKMDSEMKVRLSHKNKEVQELYKNFLGEPCGEVSHKYLHTTYSQKSYRKE